MKIQILLKRKIVDPRFCQNKIGTIITSIRRSNLLLFKLKLVPPNGRIFVCISGSSVVQLVEQRAVNAKIPGPSPGRGAWGIKLAKLSGKW